jgi:hypothetical protein
MIDYLIITRLTVPHPQWRIKTDRAWLEGRCRIFDRVCVPSILRQTDPQFRWILLTGPETPHLRRYESIDPRIITLTIEDMSQARSSLMSLVDFSSEWTLSTRLDNDDALAFDFVEKTKQSFRGEVEFFNHPKGYVYWQGRVTDLARSSNSFATCVEKSKEFKGIYQASHLRLSPIRNISDTPMWVRVIHPTNSVTPPGIWDADSEWRSGRNLGDRFITLPERI